MEEHPVVGRGRKKRVSFYLVTASVLVLISSGLLYFLLTRDVQEPGKKQQLVNQPDRVPIEQAPVLVPEHIGQDTLHKEKPIKNKKQQDLLSPKIHRAPVYASADSSRLQALPEMLSPALSVYEHSLTGSLEKFSFRWKPAKAGTVVLQLKADGTTVGEYRTFSTDEIKVDLQQYARYDSIAWELRFDNVRDVWKGTVVFKKE